METKTLLNVTEAAEARRSIRKYTDQAIPQEHIDEILRVAGLAPSPWNIQPWRVIVVKGHEAKQALMGAAYGQPQVGAAAAVFVIYSDMQDALASAEDFIHPGYGDKIKAEANNVRATFEKMGSEKSEQWGYAESNIFLGFLLLAAQSRGYSTSAMLGFDAQKVRDLYNLSANVLLPALVAMGTAAEEGFPHHRHELDRFVKVID